MGFSAQCATLDVEDSSPRDRKTSNRNFEFLKQLVDLLKSFGKANIIPMFYRLNCSNVLSIKSCHWMSCLYMIDEMAFKPWTINDVDHIQCQRLICKINGTY